ncbi:MAG: carboxylesterase family protein [Myxococcales bacterium]|nr:carboxylesterase family protein [Myxococcales bacterium]
MPERHRTRTASTRSVRVGTPILLALVLAGVACHGDDATTTDGGDTVDAPACPELSPSATTVGGETCAVEGAFDCPHAVTCGGGGGSDTTERCRCAGGRWVCGIVPCTAPEVGVAQGVIRGAADGPVYRFLGIPYARPPVGELRWRAPQPLPPARDRLEALEFGPGCMQTRSIMTEAAVLDEDCLTLNVWAPSDPGPHPVMVFIHGGGFNTGASCNSIYDGSVLARRHGVVLVTFNYRLGPLGFLAHPRLTAEDPAHPASGGWGFEDQRAALEWVRDNIAAFGGDPADVTLFGQSAGGLAVCAHLVSPRSAGLFRRVAMQSGPCFELFSTLEQAEAQGEAFAAALGCDTAPDPLACLRAKPAAEILGALPLRLGMFFGEGALWAPVIDGWNLAAEPSHAVRDGGPRDLEVLLGSNGREGSLIRMMTYPTGLTADAYEDFVELVFGEHAAAVLDRYPVSAYGSVEDALDDAIGTFAFVCPTRRTARALTAAGARVYLYRFLHAPGYLPFPDMGSYHTAELPFVFGTPPAGRSFSPEEQALADAMVGYWGRFAADGAPGGSGAAAWPLHEAAADPHLSLDVFAIGAAAGYLPDDCDFWDALPVQP